MKHAITNFLVTSHEYLGVRQYAEAELLDEVAHVQASAEGRARKQGASHSFAVGYLERDTTAKGKARAASKARRQRREAAES